ncbi:MAG: GAF domain-containing protein, partial [Gemmatimonadota bacterium]|nr:GAF domain-containing protein [Gemmatimonadota bacterium]
RALQQSLRGEQRKAGNLEIVAEVARHITGLIDHNQTQVCETTVRMVVDRFGYEVVSIFIIEHDREHAVLYATEGAFAHKKAIGHLYPLDKGVMGFVCRSGRSYQADDVRSDPYWVDNPLDQKKSEQIRSVISAPLKFADKTLGCMHIESTRIAAFEESDRLMLETLTGHLAVTLDNARLYQALQQAYADLQTAQENILQAERKKTALDTALQTGLTLSHEINNPLTAIIGFAELLNREHPENSEYQIILEAGQRIAEVVRRLRQLKSVELKSYVSDIPIQMIDLDIPVGKEK